MGIKSFHAEEFQLEISTNKFLVVYLLQIKELPSSRGNEVEQ